MYFLLNGGEGRGICTVLIVLQSSLLRCGVGITGSLNPISKFLNPVDSEIGTLKPAHFSTLLLNRFFCLIMSQNTNFQPSTNAKICSVSCISNGNAASSMYPLSTLVYRPELTQLTSG